MDLHVSRCGRPGRPPGVDVLWKVGAGKSLPYAVVADVGDPAQSIEQAERVQDRRVDADADVGIAGFDPLQRRA
jgi:hypothetical protein